MNDIRGNICNKICYIDGYAYVAGGSSQEKSEKFSVKENRWINLPNHPIKNNLEDWSCALAQTQEIDWEKIKALQEEHQKWR